MDRRRRRTGALALASAAVAAAALAADAGPPLQAMRWLAPGADAARVLATRPSECLARTDPEIEVGRAAFRTPVLLGGQAARAGLSCEACHRNGRGNPDFLFPGVSGLAGAADVTHSLFSRRRGNGVHDPKPIPDLGGPRAALKVPPAELEGFVRGLVVEEFDGPPPTSATLAGLVAYVRAMDPAACANEAEPVTLAGAFDDVRRAGAAAQARLAANDHATALLMLAAARAGLGQIDERYAGLKRERARLRAADAALAQVQEAVRQERPDAGARLAGWAADLPALEAALARREARSLYHPGRLSAATKRRSEPGLPSGAS